MAEILFVFIKRPYLLGISSVKRGFEPRTQGGGGDVTRRLNFVTLAGHLTLSPHPSFLSYISIYLSQTHTHTHARTASSFNFVASMFSRQAVRFVLCFVRRLTSTSHVDVDVVTSFSFVWINSLFGSTPPPPPEYYADDVTFNFTQNCSGGSAHECIVFCVRPSDFAVE